MKKDTYKTIFLDKCSPSVIQFMLDQQYPYFQHQNGIACLKLNLREYVCLEDLMNGKLINYISIDNQSVMSIFFQLYLLIKHLRDNQLQYFKMNKQEIWIHFQDQQVVGILLSHPQAKFESNFDIKKKVKRDIFQELYNMLEIEQLKKEEKELLIQCLDKDMNFIEKMVDILKEGLLILSNNLLQELNKSIQYFTERMNEIKCDIPEFKVILQNAPYYFYQAILQQKSTNQLNENIIFQLSDLKTICSRFGNYKILHQFLSQQEILIKLNNHTYLANGHLLYEFLSYSQQNNIPKINNFNIIHTLMEQISRIITIDEAEVLQLLCQFEGNIESQSNEEKNRMLQLIEKYIENKIKRQLQELN